MGDLDRELKNWKNKGVMVPQDQTLDWFVQLIMAVQYIHSQKMLHRDLKCKNVFLTENKTVKIGTCTNSLHLNLPLLEFRIDAMKLEFIHKIIIKICQPLNLVVTL